MQRSSETIGAIAAALAKAQAELTNPEKSLTATIRASNPRDHDQTFRYAALSSGLDIVRKALGGHEIATVQTTAIDKETDLIRLTTTLAHSSGEWLSSEWPVCPISETAAPRRMGAALTYARRFALFTLVGIAGEDDFDAPDLAEGGKADAANKDGAAHKDGVATRLLQARSPLLPRLKQQSQSRLLSRTITLAPGAVALWQKPIACATRSTASSSPRSHASSAAGHHPKRITFALPNRARSAARSATNTRSQSAGCITATYMVTETRPHGGPALASILCLLPLNSGGGRASRNFPPPLARNERFTVAGG
jgi:hypothetical protein